MTHWPLVRDWSLYTDRPPGGMPWRPLVYTLLSAGIVAFVARDPAVGNGEIGTDGHAILSLELAATRVLCGAPSALSNRYRLVRYVQEHPDARFLPLRDVAARQAGSVSAFCAAIDQPFVNNENSLMVLESWLLRLRPGLSQAGLGRTLHALRLAILLLFEFVLLDCGLSVVAAVGVTLAGVGILRTVDDLVFAAYPFFPMMVLLLVSFYILVLRYGLGVTATGRLGVSAAAGALGAWVVNMRSSYLPIVALLFLMFLAEYIRRARPAIVGRLARARVIAAAALAFGCAYGLFQYVFIDRSLPSNMAYNSSYHTIAHPLVLGLSVPESDLSRREGIQWVDQTGVELANRMVPGVSLLGAGYDRALFAYYRHLWREAPGEMTRVYVSKAAMVGQSMFTILRSRDGLIGRIMRLLLTPLSLLPNGIALFALYGAITIGALCWSPRSTSLVPALLAMVSAVAVLLMVESAIIMSRYVPAYHSYLAFYALMLSIAGVQVLANGGWALRNRIQRETP